MSARQYRKPSTGVLPSSPMKTTKKVKITWATLQDALAAHLYATGVVRENRDIGEIWIKKIYEPDQTIMAELTIELKD